MNFLKKIVVLVVICMILFPLVMFAGTPYYSFGTNGRYNIAATSGNKTLSFDSAGKLSLSGLDSNATVKLSVTAADGSGQKGLHIISGTTGAKTDLGPTAEVKVSDLQNSGFTAKATEQLAGESAELPLKVDATGMVNSKPLPFLNQQPDPPSSSYGQPGDNGQSAKSPSDKAGGGGGSGSKEGLVPCDGADCTLDKLKEMGANIYNYLAGLGAIMAVGAIVLAGFSYIKSGGDPSEMKEAKKKIVYAITGLIILGASVLIVNTVLKVFQPKAFQKVEDIK